MQRYTLDDFLKKSAEQNLGQGTFELENPRMLEVNLNGEIWTKMGSMVAYVGNVKFEREKILEKGIGNLLKKTVTGEGAKLTKAVGQGKVYLADGGKTIHILQLQNDSIFVNGNDLLAFEPSVDWDIKMMKKVTAMLAGGLFNVKLTGSGMVAFTCHFEPLTLQVSPGQPVFTDPNATIAWSGSLQPNLKVQATLKSFFGRGSGESLQMEFIGQGWVVIQPFEEVSFQAGSPG